MFRALAPVAVLATFSTPCFAGFYTNVEANSSFTGSNYSSTTTDLHLGYENSLGNSGSWYLQGGPAFITPDGGDSSTELSAKVGGGFDVTEKVNIYGEFSLLTDTTNTYGTKVGLKWSF